MTDGGTGPPDPHWNAPPPPGAYGVPPPGWSQPGYPGGYYAPVTDSKAVTALVLAIVSFVLCPVIPAIVAIVLAGQAARSIRASGGRLHGEGLVTAARIVSWINLVVFAVIIGVVFALAAVTKDEFHTTCVTINGVDQPC